MRAVAMSMDKRVPLSTYRVRYTARPEYGFTLNVYAVASGMDIQLCQV